MNRYPKGLVAIPTYSNVDAFNWNWLLHLQMYIIDENSYIYSFLQSLEYDKDEY